MKPEKDSCAFNFSYFKSGEWQLDESELSGQTSLAWLNLSYNASVGWCCASQKTTKPLLQRLNGHFKWHSLNGLLGPSGAGKTTLLNCLVGSVATQQGSQLYVDARIVNPVSCLIEQTVNQSITGQLTVRQILQYAYDFKNGRSQDYLKRKLILSVLEDMMLDESILSTTFERCSGGEQKRIAIAQELVALETPHFLIIDEPTTGLDSQAAYTLMSCLKRLSTQYRMTIITSIHVPNDQTLALFDKLYVLAKGGVCIYSGTSEQLQSSLGNCLPRFTQTEEKPIEAIIKLACKDLGNSAVVSLANHFSETEFKSVYSQLPRLRTLPHALSTKPKSFSISDLTTDVCRRSQTTFLALYRTFLLQLACFVLNICIYSTIFDHSMVSPSGCSSLNSENATCISEEPARSEALLKENLNYLFYTRLLTSNLLVICSYSTFSFLLKNIPFEHRNRWYSLGSSYWSICLVTILQMSIFVFFISLTTYFASEQHIVDLNGVNWTRFAHFLASLWLYFSFIQGVGEVVAVLTSQTEIGIVISCILLVLVQLLDEFFFTSEQLPNTVTVVASDLLGVKHFTRYMIYAIYGLTRCDPETEFSWILAKRNVNSETLCADVALASVRILAIRLVGFLFFYGKSTFITNNQFICNLGKVRKPLTTNELKFLPFERINSSQFDDHNSWDYNKKSMPCSNTQNRTPKTIFAWQNLTLHSSISFYKLGSSSPSSHPILRSLNGHLTFGSLTALMGMSGAGKTSLLRVLNGQCQTRLDSQTRFFVSTLEPIRTCYITQNVTDHLLSGLTVQQLIVYASKLKNNCNSKVDHEEIAQRLLRELDLVGIEKNQVEDCSGGERKRLALAVELTSARMPSLVCIDEPTSGLDSNSAYKVVSCLRSIAHHHSLAIVASLHQPSNDLLFLFDQLYVLARGGQCVFSGPPGHIKEHLSSVPAIDLTESKYPIEVLIKHSCSTVDNPIVQQLVQRNTAQLSPDQYLINTHSLVDGLPPNRVCFSFASLSTLTQRYASSLKSYRAIQMLLFTCLYLLLGTCLTIFFNPQIANASGCVSLEDNFNSTCYKSAVELLTDKQLETNLNYNVFASIYLYMLVLVQSGLMLFYELPLFLAEHRNGSYSTGAFYLSTCAFEILPLIPSLILYVSIIDIYETIRPGVYWHLLLIFFLGVLAYQGLAHICVLLAPENVPHIATAITSYYVFTIILCNVIMPIRRLHYIYQLFSNFSVIRFTLEASLLLQYGFGRCSPEQFSLPLMGIDLTDEDYYRAIAMLVVNILIYRGIAFGCLVCKANPAENQRQRAVDILKQLKQLEAPEAIIAGFSNSSGKAPIEQLI